MSKAPGKTQNNGEPESSQHVFDQMPIPVWRTGLDRSHIYFNQAWREFTGRTSPQEEVAGWTAAIHPDDRERHLRVYHKAFDLRQAFEIDYRLITRTGDYRWINDVGKPFYDEAGEFAGYLGFGLEIRPAPAESLPSYDLDGGPRNSDHYFRSLIEHASDIVSIYDAGGIRRYSSPSIERVLGYKPEDLVGRSGFELLHEDDRERMASLFSELTRLPGVTITEHFRCRHKDGSWRILESTATNLLHQPAVANIVVNSRDITERNQLDSALQASQDRFRSFMNNLPGFAWIKTVKGQYVYVNENLRLSLRDPESNYLGKTDEDLWPAEFASEYRANDEWVLREQSPLHTIENWQHEGRLRSVFVSKFPIFDEHGQVSMIGGVSVDITEQQETEAALHEAERKYREIFENATEGIFQTTPAGRFITANPAMARILGFDSPEELIRMRTDIAREHYVDPKRREDFKRLLEEHGVVSNFEIEAYRKDGSKIWTTDHVRAVRDQSGAVVYYEGISQEITERKRAEATGAAFATLARKLSGARTQLDAARIISQTALDLFGWDACNFDLYDADNDLTYAMLNVDTIDGAKRDVKPSRPSGKPTARGRHVIDHGPELLCRDEPACFDADCIPYGDESRPSASLMTVPVRHGARVVGILSIQSYKSHAYNEDDLKGLAALADHCGEALNRIRAEQSLHESEQRFRQLAENIDDIIWMADVALTKMLYISPAFEQIFGISRERLYENPNSFLEVVHPDDRARVEQMLERQSAGNYEPFEYRIIRSDGSERWILRRTFPILDGEGEIYRIAGIAQDITERKRAQEDLRDSEERYRELFENARDAIYVHDLSGRYVSINRMAEQLSGFRREEIIGRHFSNFIAPNHLRSVRENLCLKLDTQIETTYEAEIIAKNGRRTPVEVNSRLVIENGVPVGVQGTARDITERKQAQEVLRVYSRALIEAQETERQRIARELHDEIGQVLTAIRINLQTARTAGNSEEGSNSIDDSIRITDEALTRVRDLSLDLRPPHLDDFGLVTALRWFIDRFSQRTGIVTEFQPSNDEERLSTETETACFRIAQEALTNVARHAEASHVSVKMVRTRDNLFLTVADDGVGFNVNERERSTRPVALGLRGMKERAEAVRGQIDIVSSPGKGTQVRARLPVSGT